jgi:hypothetical protein
MGGKPLITIVRYTRPIVRNGYSGPSWSEIDLFYLAQRRQTEKNSRVISPFYSFEPFQPTADFRGAKVTGATIPDTAVPGSLRKPCGWEERR